MYREIKKKSLILKNRKPYSVEVVNYIEEMNRTDWISSCLRLYGTPVSKESVQKIAKGELLVDVSLTNHQLIHRYMTVMKQIQSMVEMGTELSERVLMKLYNLLFGSGDDSIRMGDALDLPGLQELYYRKNNPVLLEWSYNPPHFNDVEEQMDILFQWLSGEKSRVNPDVNPILRAVMLHNKTVEIYPFGEHSGTMARVAMLYELMSAGFPPIRLAMNEQEYNSAIVLYLKKEDNTLLYDAVEKGIFNQLELMIQLTAIQ